MKALHARILLATALALLATSVEAAEGRRQYRIGVLNEAWAANHPTVEGLRTGLRELGFEEGRDVVFDIRFTQGKPEATPAAAEALVKAGVDLIFTSNESATRAAKNATQMIPIVFTLVGDPVISGIVKTVAKPGENITGVSSLTTELAAKRLEILTILAPKVRRVWAIHYGDDPSSIAAIWSAEAAAKQLKVEIVSRPVYNAQQLEHAVKSVRPGDALLPPEVGTLDVPAALLELSISSRIPAVFATSLWVGHGGLVSYGSDYHAEGVQAARLVAKILRGARPGDLPVEGADKIDLAVNLKTASALGVAVPRKIILRADTIRR
ncbi:MAG TPA: ABC transporter substrate-binding protein [Burkholderiales bacterium]|jgi:putative ABC transport system substrate-binding protein